MLWTGLTGVIFLELKTEILEELLSTIFVNYISSTFDASFTIHILRSFADMERKKALIQ